MRREATFPERLLWSRLRGDQIAGRRFRRQYVIGHAIVDFCCPTALLVVEVDGRSHDDRLEADRVRDVELEQLGYRVLRITNDEVVGDLEQVVERIHAAVAEIE